MLRKEHAIYKRDNLRIFPDRLLRQEHSHYVHLAESMLEIYENGVGKTRRALHREIDRLLSGIRDCPLRRIHAFCKLLDDASIYDRDRKGYARKLRKRVFEISSRYHPLVKKKKNVFEHQADEIQKYVIEELKKENPRENFGLDFGPDWKRNWNLVQAKMYNDVMEFHRLVDFRGFSDARALLSRYNVAQVQAAMFFATEITVELSKDYKSIIRAAKLARLMHTIAKTPSGYSIRFDGPASVLRRTRLYGANMANFIPTLLAGRGWKLHARLKMPPNDHPGYLHLSEKDGLRSPARLSSPFDSTVEKAFYEKWKKADIPSWGISRETEILHRNQKAFFPDFVFTHINGRKVFLEIIGFWTADYLEFKARTLSLFKDHPIIIAVHENLKERLPDMNSPMITYNTAIKIKPVINILENPGLWEY